MVGLVTDNGSVSNVPGPRGREAYKPPKATLPWERQPGEPVRSYRAFARYRDLDPDGRGLGMVATEMHLDYDTVWRWRTKWRWVERVNAWDQEVDRRVSQAALKSIEKMNERHVGIAQMMQTKAIERLRRHDAQSLSNRDLERWVDRSVRVERLARGLNDNAAPQINVAVSQQQGQIAAAKAEAGIVGSISEMLAARPGRLQEAVAAIGQLRDLAEEGYSIRNEPDQDLPGMPEPRDVSGG